MVSVSRWRLALMFAMVEGTELVQRSHGSCRARRATRFGISGIGFWQHSIDDDDVRQNLPSAPIQIRDGCVQRDSDFQKTEVAQRVGVALELDHRAGPLSERARHLDTGTRSTRGGLPGATSMTTKLFSSSTSPKSSCMGDPAY